MDNVAGIPTYPTSAQLAGSKKRHAVAAASVHTGETSHSRNATVKWTGKLVELRSDPEFGTLEVKFGKAFKASLRVDVKERLHTWKKKFSASRKIITWSRDIRVNSQTVQQRQHRSEAGQPTSFQRTWLSEARKRKRCCD